nr:hypothetical protein [Thermacetogenium phaeum]
MISKAELKSSRESYQSAPAKYQSDHSNLVATSHEADLRIVLANLQTARSYLEQARENLDNARIIARFDGYVAEINGNVGQWTGGGAVSSGSSSDSSQFYIYLSSTELQLSAKINEARYQQGENRPEGHLHGGYLPGRKLYGGDRLPRPDGHHRQQRADVRRQDLHRRLQSAQERSPGQHQDHRRFRKPCAHSAPGGLDFARTYMVTTAMSNGGNRRSGTQTGDGDGSRLYATGTVSSSN